MSRQTRKAKRNQAEAQRAAREAKLRQIQTVVGYVIVGATVVAAIVLSLLRQLPPAVAVGLILLALFRLYALRKTVVRDS